MIDGLSLRAISRELGHSRKTIRKALAHGTPPGYRDIAEDRERGDLLDRLGFPRPSIAPPLLGAHGFLQFTKPGWTLKDPGAETASGINTHYELRGPGWFQLHVEVHPYEGSLASKPDRLRELAPLLPIRVELHRRLREGLRHINDLPGGVRASTAWGAEGGGHGGESLCGVYRRPQPVQFRPGARMLYRGDDRGDGTVNRARNRRSRQGLGPVPGRFQIAPPMKPGLSRVLRR